MTKLWGILAILLLALTGCGAGAAASASPTAATTAVATPTATMATNGESICKDEAGDSTSQSVDLDQTRLLSDGRLMFASFDTVANVPVTGTVLYSVTAWSPDGRKGYQFGTKFENGREIANFVLDLGSAKQDNITNGAVSVEKEINVRYPLAKLAGLGGSFGWSATVTVDGKDVDRCPGGDVMAQFPNDELPDVID